MKTLKATFDEMVADKSQYPHKDLRTVYSMYWAEIEDQICRAESQLNELKNLKTKTRLAYYARFHGK